jgi:pilus assembly protein Flp/PilA
MRSTFQKLLVKAQVALASLKNEDGQDLVEYALVVALVAFAATAGMKTLASGLNLAFSNIAATLNSYIT